MKLRLFDWGALVFSLAIFLLFFLYGRSLSQDDGYLLVEDSEGKSLYSLAENRDLHIEGPLGETVIQIRDGHAGFIHSDCPDQLCVQMGDIENSGEWAACLPNQVFILIEGGPDDEEEEELDASGY